MNNLEKLTEATIKALQGKLTEYKSEIHKIYDDEGPELQDFVNEVDAHHDFIFAPLSRWEYDYFGEDIAKKGYEVLQNYLDDTNTANKISCFFIFIWNLFRIYI